MGVMVSQITNPTVCLGTDQRNNQSAASPGTGEFPAQKASNVENGSIWWCHQVIGHEIPNDFLL